MGRKVLGKFSISKALGLLGTVIAMLVRKRNHEASGYRPRFVADGSSVRMRTRLVRFSHLEWLKRLGLDSMDISYQSQDSGKNGPVLLVMTGC